tara:strand:- start:596 stop:871 length:276 start_codon:yes stop_codon:yes gene_type:complete
VSSKQIEKALINKGYPVDSVEYIRNAPTPSGYGKGYDINFINIEDSFVEIEDVVFEFDSNIELSPYMEFDSFQESMAWIDSLPNLNKLQER